MTVFQERFATLRHFETFSHERMGADEEPRMDQAGLLMMLTQHKLLPAIVSRNEACALYKAVTRGSPLHQRHGMLFADFRECIRRVGAWKGFKLWGLSKADLAAIQDANSSTVWSGAETERTATLSSICKGTYLLPTYHLVTAYLLTHSRTGTLSSICKGTSLFLSLLPTLCFSLCSHPLRIRASSFPLLLSASRFLALTLALPRLSAPTPLSLRACALPPSLSFLFSFFRASVRRAPRLILSLHCVQKYTESVPASPATGRGGRRSVSPGASV